MKAQLKQLAKGLTPREVLDKFKTIQMVDVHVPTADYANWCSRATPNPSPSTLSTGAIRARGEQ